ncbi:DeoR/GlpR family DNA-binding transcription regulator [Clavibacter michiganensis]|uniref:DeoR/GlpR family DNA-binding transcription regulator n=1 Tax=Clavibacter michiganensis TaxID=28447 RepID=UPI003EBF652A
MRDAREFVILDRLRATRSATVAELAEAAGTSDATIRRDLARLDEQGALRRTHGGAVLVEVDAPFAEVEQVNREAKERIARAAAAQIQDGQSVVLDIGTTTLHLAEQLRGRTLTVITANVAAFDVLRDDRSVRLILLPGDWDPVYRSVSGPLTAESLRMLHADHAFVGVSGIADNGDLRDTTMAQVPIKRAMAEMSDRVTVLADSSKFPGTGAGRVALTASLTQLITEAAPHERVSQGLADKGVSVTVA